MKRSRRSFLRAAVLAGSAGIAGCNGGGTPTRVTAVDPGGTDTATSSGTGTGNGTATDSPTDAPTETDGTPTTVGSNERWDMLQVDGANTGAVDLDFGAYSGSEMNWSTTLDSRPGRQPAFDEERLYVPTRGMLHAIDRETRETVWTFQSPETPVTTPVLPGDGFVYVVTGSGAYKINAEDGWFAFEYSFNSQIDDFLGTDGVSPPTLAGGRLVYNLVVRRSGRATRSRTVSLSLDGNRQWASEPSTPATAPATVFAPTPAVAGGSVYLTAGHGENGPLATRNARVYELNLSNGGTRWSTNYEGKGWSSVSVSGDRLYFADDFATVFTTGGNKVVRRTLDPPPNAFAVAVGDQYAFMASRTYEGNEGRLFAVDDDGRIQWTFEGEGNLFVPTASQETVYVVSASGSLFALAQSDGLVRWEQDLGLSGQVLASGVAISTEELYLTAATGTDPATLFSVSPA